MQRPNFNFIQHLFKMQGPVLGIRVKGAGFTTAVRLIAITLFVGVLFLSISANAFAAAGINRQINFQGKLVDSNGLTVADSTYSIIFSFYNASENGTALWTETDSVTTVAGIFRVSLGALTPIPANFNFNWDGLYLGIKISTEAQEMTPRIQMTAVPMAFNAQQVAGLTVQDENGNASTSGTLKIPNAKTVSFAGTAAFGAGTTGLITLGSTTNALALTTSGETNLALPTAGTLLTNTAAAVQTVTSTQSTRTVLGIADSTALTGAIKGLVITLSGANAQDQTGLEFNLSNASGSNLNDIVGTAESWKVSKAGALTVASCTGCGGGTGGSNWTLDTTNGLIFPNNNTLDFLLGGTATTSAKFSVLNINSGTPVASIAGTLSLGSATGTTRTIGGTAMNPLQLGDASTGDLIFAPANTTAMTIKNGGNVGIGTTNPTSALHIYGTSATKLQVEKSGGAIFRLLADGLGYMGTSNGTAFAIQTNSANAMWIDVSQQVGIGATAPVTLFDVSQKFNVTSGGNVGIGNTAPLTALDITGSASLSANLSLKGALTAHTFNILDNGTLNFQRYPSGDAANNSSVLFLNNSGNVGIGNTAPSALLSVGSTSQFQVNSGGAIAAATGITSSGSITFSGLNTDKGLVYTNGTGGLLAQTAQGGANTLLHGNGASAPTFSAVSLSADVTGILPTANGGSWWNSASGALFPGNSTLDLLIGGTTTASAKFGFINLAGGNPTATISSNLSLIVPTGNAPAATFNLLNNGTLNFQRSPGGDAGLTSTLFLASNGNVGIGTTAPTTALSIGGTGSSVISNNSGNLTITPAANLIISSGSVGISNTTPLATLDVRPNLTNGGTIAIASASGSTSFAGLLVDNTGTGDLFTASKSGAIKFVITNSGDLQFAGQTNFLTTLKSAATAARTITLPDSTGTLLTNTAAAVQTVTSTQTSGTVLGITDSTALAGAIKGLVITLSGTNAQDQTGLEFNLSNASGSNLNDIVGTGSTWKVSKAGALTVASCVGCGGSNWTLDSVNGILKPNSNVVDILFGGASTVSAKFGFINMAGGNPTATISSNLSLAVPTGNAPAATFNLLNNGTLNFRRSAGGDAGLTSTLFLANNGYVGIGTTVPGSLLTLANNGWFSGISTSSGVTNMFKLNTADQIQVGAALNIDGGITLPTDAGNVTLVDLPLGSSSQGTANSYTFKIGSDNIMTVYGENSATAGTLQNGRVGIGTITPLWKLQVSDSQAGTASAMIENTAVNTAANPGAACVPGTACHSGLNIRLGAAASATNPGGNDRFINFMRGDSLILGKVRGNNTGTGIAFDTTGGDYAEWFKKENASEDLPIGTLVCLAQNGSGGVTKCSLTNNSIVGVVSGTFGFIGNSQHENDTGYITVGIVGQLPVFVAKANGEIKSGDALTFSNIPGVAVKAKSAGAILGRALESYSADGTGTIKVYANAGWYNPDAYLTSTGEYSITKDSLAMEGSATPYVLKDSLGDTLNKAAVFSDVAVANLKAGLVNTQELNADSINVAGQTLNDYVTKILALQGETLQVQTASPSAQTTFDLASDPLFNNLTNKVTDLQTKLDILSQKADQQASTSAFLMDIATGRVVAGLEIITPKVTAQTILTDMIGSATGSDIALQLTADGKFVIKDENGNPAITFDNQGNAVFKGIITADKIKANQIEGLEILTNRISSLDEHLASLSANMSSSVLSASQSGILAEIATSEAELLSSTPKPVNGELTLANLSVDGLATISANLRVKGNGLIEGMLNIIDTLTTRDLIVSNIAQFLGDTIFKGNINFFGNVKYLADITFQGRPTFNSDTAGFAVIKKGADRVDVTFDKEYENIPIINASLTFDQTKLKDGSIGDPRILEKKIFDGEYTYIVSNRTAKGFTIALNKKAADDITFSWIAITVKDVKNFEGAVSISTIGHPVPQALGQ